MKINTNSYALWAGLLLSTALGAYAVPVTFQVDMGYQITLGNFNTDGTDHIELKSGFNNNPGWPGYEMTNVPSTTVYSVTVGITDPAPGNLVEYKFHIWGTRDVWENFVGLGYIYTNSGNRAFQLASTAQSVPLAYFNDVWSGTVPLTVQVDMAAQSQAGSFVPGTDTVEVKGSWDGWSVGTALTNDATGATAPTNIYSMTFSIGSPAPGGLAAYKFHSYGLPGHDIYESGANRILMVASPETVLPLTCFNGACLPPISAALYLQVDMSSQILIGAFDTTTSQIWADGDNLGGWGNPPEGLQMIEDTSRPGIYTNRWTGLISPNATFPFKFKIWYPDSNYKWEDSLPTNRWVAWTGSEPLDDGKYLISYGPVMFDNFQANANDYLPADTLVTFTVSMTNAHSYSGFLPEVAFDKTMGVAVNGSFWPWWNWNQAPPGSLILTNNTTGDDWLYSQTVLFPKGSAVQMWYKYGIDDLTGVTSLNNEAPDGSDRVRFIRQ